MIFNSNFRYLNDFEGKVEDIKNEPMFFNCNFKFAIENGGPITKSFLNALPEVIKKQPLVFDSRVHMLMPGWYPCIPGWHHDDVPRSNKGQPNYKTPEYFAKHYMGLVNGDICPTKFIDDPLVEVSKVIDGDLVYKKWHKEIETQIKEGDLKPVIAKSNKIISFDADTFHAGDKAISNGWRWFGRISIQTDRVNNITNEIRKQVQVYLEFPMEGW